MDNTFISEYGVCLRNWKDDDLIPYAELIGDPQVMKFIGNGNIRSKERAWSEITAFQRDIEAKGWSRWAVSLGENGPLIGYAGFSQKEWGIDFGYRFMSSYWGTAYPYIASFLAAEYGFMSIGFANYCGIVDKKNTNAVRLNKRFFINAEIDTIIINEKEHFMYTFYRDVFINQEVSKKNRVYIDKLYLRMKKRAKKNECFIGAEA